MEEVKIENTENVEVSETTGTETALETSETTGTESDVEAPRQDASTEEL